MTESPERTFRLEGGGSPVLGMIVLPGPPWLPIMIDCDAGPAQKVMAKGTASWMVDFAGHLAAVRRSTPKLLACRQVTRFENDWVQFPHFVLTLAEGKIVDYILWELMPEQDFADVYALPVGVASGITRAASGVLALRKSLRDAVQPGDLGPLTCHLRDDLRGGSRYLSFRYAGEHVNDVLAASHEVAERRRRKT